MTPEGRVKQRVNKLLEKYSGIYRFMPVQLGYGEMTVDYLLCVRGAFAAIETKAPGKKPTARQEATMARIRAAGGRVFVVSHVDDLEELKSYLDGCCSEFWEVVGHEPDDPD
jgi:hypothetical protein